jgi:hypothetical protein
MAYPRREKELTVKRLMILLLIAFAGAFAQTTCSMDMIAGTYVISVSGALTIVQPGQAPTTASGTIFGIVSISWDGTTSGAGTVSVMGPPVDYEVLGTTQLNTNCTGTIQLKTRLKGSRGPYNAGTETDRFVFDAKSNTILTTIVDFGPTMFPACLGVWKRISPSPGASSW